MSGPALKQRDAHHSIHEAALHEAEEMTSLFHRMVEIGDTQRAISLAEAIVEHWKTRTLGHAADEELGFYRQWSEQHTNQYDDIAQLTRDHDLMRKLVDEIEQLLSTSFDSRAIAFRFDTLLWVNETHSHDEERCLLNEQPLRTHQVELALERSEQDERERK